MAYEDQHTMLGRQTTLHSGVHNWRGGARVQESTASSLAGRHQSTMGEFTKPHSSPAIVKAWACSVLCAIAEGHLARAIWGSCPLPCRRPGQLQAGQAPLVSTGQASAELLGQAHDPAKERHMLHACGSWCAGRARLWTASTGTGLPVFGVSCPGLSRLQETSKLPQSLPLRIRSGSLHWSCELTGSVEASAADAAAAAAGGAGGSSISCWAAGTSGRRVSRLSSTSLLPGPCSKVPPAATTGQLSTQPVEKRVTVRPDEPAALMQKAQDWESGLLLGS